VGLRAIMPTLDRLGHEVIACPTIVLSNHLGHRRTEGAPVTLDTFVAVLGALESNGWLARVDAVLTGYLPSAGHVAALVGALRRLAAHRPEAVIVCDPVLGDIPEGLYVPREVAEAVRAELLPLATHTKPNLFELAYLSGRSVESIASLTDVVVAARTLPVPVVLASSIPLAEDRLANVAVTREAAGFASVVREPEVPHGTGDLVSAVFTAGILSGHAPFEAAALASAAVAAAIEASHGSDELALHHPSPWHEAPPFTMTQVL
jgi:pyridoxine kinase